MGLRVGRGRLAAGGVAGLGFAALLVACGAVKERGELMVAMQTDLSLPKDIDHIEINVTSYGKTLWDQDYLVGPGGAGIPATLGVVGDPTNPSAPVEIQIIAKNETKAGGNNASAYRVLRDVTTTVPDGRTALLRMPIEWLCWDVNTAAAPNGAGAPQEQSCLAGQTCVAGICKTSSVDSDDLEPFDPSVVFGGSADAAGGTCFETISCFAQGSSVTVDPTNCSVPAPASAGAGINVALLRANSSGTADANGIGVCTASACYVPLDEDPNEGWTLSGGQILLPPAVCQNLPTSTPAPPANKVIQGVEITTACATKTAEIPTCGDWSSVGGNAANGIKDGGTSSPGGCIVGTWTQTQGGNTCNGETENNTVNISYDGSQYFVALTAGPFDNGSGGCESLNDQQIPAVASPDGTTLTFSPSLSQVCSCSSAAVSITLQVAGCGSSAGPTLTATENFSGVTQCPSGNEGAPTTDAGFGSSSGSGGGSSSSGGGSSSGATSEDASTLSGTCLAYYDCCVTTGASSAATCDANATTAEQAGGPDGTECQDALTACQQQEGSSSGGSSSGGSNTNFCATCGTVTCTVTATFAQSGSSATQSDGGTTIDASPTNDCADSSCPASYMCCSNACTDVQNDPNNCGNCGNDCGGGTCQGGQCQGGSTLDAGKAACGPDNCTGCCESPSGPCDNGVVGQIGSPCGINGSQCVTCSSTDFCNTAGVCEPTSDDGGP